MINITVNSSRAYESTLNMMLHTHSFLGYVVVEGDGKPVPRYNTAVNTGGNNWQIEMNSFSQGMPDMITRRYVVEFTADPANGGLSGDGAYAERPDSNHDVTITKITAYDDGTGRASGNVVWTATGLDVDISTDSIWNSDGKWIHTAFDSDSIRINAHSGASGQVDAPVMTRSMTYNGGSGDENVVGSDQADTLNGNGGSDYLIGMDGNDYIDAGAGNDSLFGGEGSDTLIGGAGDDFIYGDSDDVILYSGSTEDYTVSQDRDEWIISSDATGTDRISGGATHVRFGDNVPVALADLLEGAGDDDTVDGGDDTVDGGDDTVDGGDDTVDGGDDTVDGGDDTVDGGDDTVDGGDDTVDGGDDTVNGGDDTVDGGNTGGGNTGGGNDDDDEDEDPVEDITDSFTGGSDNDKIVGDNSGNVLKGKGGDDEVKAGSGSDKLYGNDGNDTIEAGSGNDTVYGGDDNDRIWAGGGHDRVKAGSGNDRIWAGGGDDTIYGGKGDDRLYDGTGRDVLRGEDGDDNYYVENEDTKIKEGKGEGTDTVYSFVNFEADDHIEIIKLRDKEDINATGNDLDNLIKGNDGENRIFGEDGSDEIHGGNGSDTLKGGGDNDTVEGGDGKDRIYGQDGNDEIHGDGGADYIKGGAGKDTIKGGEGADKLYGHEGADTFVFSSVKDSRSGGRDTIYEFEEKDLIDLSDIDARKDKQGDQKFKLIGDDDFSGRAGELKIDGKYVKGDVDGDGGADLVIKVGAHFDLTSDSFLL